MSGTNLQPTSNLQDDNEKNDNTHYQYQKWSKEYYCRSHDVKRIIKD